jgi:CheY-like chemotaxis protein
MNTLLAEEVKSREAVIEQRTAELKRALEEARAGNEAKVRLLANTSHELRTPLNGIIGHAELLLLDELSAETRDGLETILKSAEGMQRVVGDLLTMSELRAAGFELGHEPFDLVEELKQVLATAQTLARAKGLKLVGAIDPELSAHRIGDRHRLRQILMNLVSNAVKFTPTGSIRLAARAIDAETLDVSVSDTGIGIAAGDIDRIFEPFYQVESSYSRHAGGTGLGLAISAELAQRMDGSLTVASRPGNGSTFVLAVRLPEARDPKSAAAPQLDVPATLEIRFRALRALVIDDAPINAAVLSNQLRALGLIDPAVAADGFAALEYLLTRPCDIVFLDCQMPGMDGYEVAQRIRKLSAEPSPTIIGVTAHAQLGERKRCLDAGMDDYLPKPIRLETLRGAILRALGET